MRFSPMSDEEIKKEDAKRLPLPPGVYDCEVIKAEDAISKAGNDMIAVTLHVYGEDGSPRTVRDWLLSAAAGKLKRAAGTFGLASSYDAGTLDASDFRGRPGKVKVRIESDETGRFPDKNVVSDYVVPDGAATDRPAPRKRVPAGIDDEIPF